MIGFIVTGHGTYAPGMVGAMEMIAGTQEKVKVIPFLQEMTLEAYTQELVNAIQTFKQEELELVVFTDLLGGTPFKTGATQAFEQKGIAIVSGVNLPMLIEGSMLRLGMTDAQELVNQLLQTGKEGIQTLVLDSIENEQTEEDFSEGI